MTQKQKYRWWSHPRSLLRHILMLDDTPHSVALGTAIGVFLGMTPTVGLQMILVGLIASLTVRRFHFNRVAAVLAVYISNPLTVVPIYWFNYKVGTLFFEETVSHEAFEKILVYDGIKGWLSTIVELSIQVGSPLIFGSLIVATIMGGLAYPIMVWILNRIHKEQSPRSTPKSEPTTVVAD